MRKQRPTRWLTLAILAALAVPTVAEAQEAIFEASFLNSPPVTVERTYVSPARNLTLPGKKIELMTGVDVTTKKQFGIPIGGGYGINDKLEIGADFSLFFAPFDGKALFSNLKAYGRYLAIPDLLALQFTFNVVGAMGDPMALSFELDAPLLLKLVGDKLWIYIQTQVAFQALLMGSDDFGMSASIGALGMFLITPAIFVDLDHQLSFVFAPDFAAAYADTAIPLGFGGGYLHRSTMTALRLNLVFFDLGHFDARGMGIMLTATQFLGG